MEERSTSPVSFSQIKRFPDELVHAGRMWFGFRSIYHVVSFMMKIIMINVKSNDLEEKLIMSH